MGWSEERGVWSGFARWGGALNDEAMNGFGQMQLALFRIFVLPLRSTQRPAAATRTTISSAKETGVKNKMSCLVIIVHNVKGS